MARLYCPKLQGTGYLYVPGPQAAALGLTPESEVTPVVLAEGLLAFVSALGGASTLLCQTVSGTNGAIRIRLRRFLSSWGVGTLDKPEPVLIRPADESDHKVDSSVIPGESVIVDLRLLLSGGDLP